MTEGHKFVVLDYVLFSLSLIVSAGIGFYYGCSGGKQKTTSEFLFGDHNLRIFPVAMSLIASGTSALGILGSTSETYLYGGQYTIEAMAVFVVAPITAIVYLPLFFKLKLSSIYEYLELRFSKSLRRVASIIYLFQTFSFIAPCLYAPASALSQVTGLPFFSTMLASGSVCILYTVMGGIKAVIMTDTIQQLLVFVGLFSIVIQGLIDLGGLKNVWRIADEGGRTLFFDFSADPRYLYSFWSIVVGGIFTWLPFYACDQCMVQRYLSVSSLSRARCAILWTTIIYFVLKVLFLLCGYIVYARYSSCDPKLSGRITNYDQILPLFVMDVLNHIPGMAGLFVAAIYSASLSAISSGLNAMATVILEDVCKPIAKHFWNITINDKKGAIISKISVVFFGGISLGLALYLRVLGMTLIQLITALYGITCGSFLAMFTLGMGFYFPNSVGMMIGSFLGGGLVFWIFIGSFMSEASVLPSINLGTHGCPANLSMTSNFSKVSVGSLKTGLLGLYQISYFHYPTVGCLVTMVLGSLASVIYGYFRKEYVNPKLIYPFWQGFADFFRSRKKDELADEMKNEILGSSVSLEKDIKQDEFHCKTSSAVSDGSNNVNSTTTDNSINSSNILQCSAL